MKSTHVYAVDHGELNRKIKKQKKYQIPEMNAVKPEKQKNIKENSNQPVKQMSENDGSKTLVFFE